MRGKDILKMGERGEEGEEGGEGRSYTFNCSFHGGVRDEEGKERGNKSGGRQERRQQQVGWFLVIKCSSTARVYRPLMDTISQPRNWSAAITRPQMLRD